MSEPYVLHGSPSTASLCVHWMLLDLGVDFTVRMLDFDRGQQRDPDYLRLNPQGRVPTLIVDGAPVAESAAILMLLAERHPEAGFGVAAGAPGRAAYLQTMVFLANGLLPAFRNWFYADKDGDPAGAEAIRQRAREQIEAAWARVDADLADGRAYLLGDRKTAADHLGAMLTRWSRNMPKPATAWPRLGAYVDRMRRDPGLREVHRREGLTDWIDDRAAAEAR
jgi:glutathione S-transferase